MERHLSPLKSIRKHCLECSSGSSNEVKYCIITDCPLYPFRLGKNPKRQGIGNHKAVIKKIVS